MSDLTDADLDRIERWADRHQHVLVRTSDVLALVTEVRRLREVLVSAEGYAIANGADLPLVAMYVEDSVYAEVIERAGCYPRDARREHPGPLALNRPPTPED